MAKTTQRKKAPRKTKKAQRPAQERKKAQARKASPKKVGASKRAAGRKVFPAKTRSSGSALAEPLPTGPHPKLSLLTASLPPGWHAGGLFLVTVPGLHNEELGPWLLGKLSGRTALGRTAFGDFVIFRDLRERARELGLAGADDACDVALLDIHYKRMEVLGRSVEEFLASLPSDDFQRAFLRRELYEAARARVGDLSDHECFGFVPALALGGAEAAESVQRQDWRVHQDLLLQT